MRCGYCGRHAPISSQFAHLTPALARLRVPLTSPWWSSQVRIFKDSTKNSKNRTVHLEFEDEAEAYSWACSMWYGGAEKIEK